MGNGIDYSIASDRLTDNLMVYLHSYIFIYHPPTLPSAQAHSYPTCNVQGPQGAMSTHMCSLGCLYKGQTFINPSATLSTPLLDESSLDAHQKLINSLNPLQRITHWAFSTHWAQTPYGKWKKKKKNRFNLYRYHCEKKKKEYTFTNKIL